jgi:hypothetical protein
MLRTRGGAVLIDRFVPTYQFVERHSRTISATPPRVYRALWEADFARSTVIRTLFMMRGLASAFRLEGSLQIRLADFLRAGFLLRGERTSEELVVSDTAYVTTRSPAYEA